MPDVTVTADALTAQLDHLRAAPTEEGTLALVVRRPAHGEREVLEEGVLDEADGLVGDNWLSRATSRALAEGRHLDSQVTVMSARMVALLASDPAEQALAGDQLYIDLDISHENLPTGSRLAIGDTTVIEVTGKPHNGCKKFVARFGEEAFRFVSMPERRHLNLRGIHVRVVEVAAVIGRGRPLVKVLIEG